MSDQGDLFVWWSETSRAAAEEIRPDTGTLRAKVYHHLVSCGVRGATDDEMQTALDMNPSTQRPRRVELHRAGLVVDSGETRLTRSCRRAVVWRVRDLR